MKTLTVAAVVLLTACGAAPAEHPITAVCTPSVNVTVPPASMASHDKTPTPRQQRNEAVQVYWDISQSMRDFASTHRNQRDDLAPVVAALDSNVLLQAHARTVEQYGVGDAIVPLPSARSALTPNATRTVLHLAAQQIGSALSNGTTQAALIVSDLELDTPPLNSTTRTVCGGIPLPSTREAGSLFGRCFENAVLAVDGPPLTRTNLLVHVFRRPSHGRELFILLLATDRTFGRRISDEIARRIGFERQVIFDSGAIAAANVRACRLSAPGAETLRTVGGCGVKCFDADSAIQAECDIRRAADDAWIVPVASVADGVTYQLLPRKPGDRDQRVLARFLIPCTAQPGIFNAAIGHSWRVRTASRQFGNGVFAQKESVRDLFDSLTDAIVRIAAPRTLRIGIRIYQ